MPAGWQVEDSGSQPVEIEIGMRWSQMWRLAARTWVPKSAIRMVNPEANEGLLSSGLRITRAGPAIVQVWRDRPCLDAWARAPAANHLQPWRRFAKEAGSTQEWGIWHRVRPIEERRTTRVWEWRGRPGGRLRILVDAQQEATCDEATAAATLEGLRAHRPGKSCPR